MVSINRKHSHSPLPECMIYIPLWYLLIATAGPARQSGYFDLHSTMVSINLFPGVVLKPGQVAHLHSTMVSINPGTFP